jgi:ABC-type anion transport system duplicated permease subunit
MAFIAWLIAMMIILAIVYHMWLFDCLVRWEYEHHREQWERDGKPRGFYWRPKECVFWLSHSAMQRLAGIVVFRTPSWAVERPECRRWILGMRVTLLVAITCVLLFIEVVFK